MSLSQATTLLGCVLAAAAGARAQTRPAEEAPAAPTAGVAAESAAESSSQPAAADEPRSARDPNGGGAPRADLRQLWRESLRPPETADSAKLRALMDELRRMQVSPVRRGKPPLAVSGGGEGPSAQPAAPQPTQPAALAAASRTAETRTLPPEVIERLKSIPATTLSRPADLADELYRCGYLEAAFAIYELAMKQDVPAETKAWVTYQMANCRRVSQADQAGQLYAKVIAEHGATTWAELARTELKLLDWNRVNRPQELLVRIRQLDFGAAGGAMTRPAASSQPAPTSQAADIAGGPTVPPTASE